nr:NADP-dependent phosphogluconate dehydrogenase [uncultured Cohaesibacter sp.]
MQSRTLADIAIIGLGVMGRNLALNFVDHGFAVSAHDAFPEALEGARPSLEAHVGLHDTLEGLVASLKKPARILMMIKAGDPVDEMIARLIPLLAKGDIVMDGGNSFYRDTERRAAMLEAEGLVFVGLGVSGGETGARFGPALMAGGDSAALAHVDDLFSAIAAKAADGGACYAAHGPGGAGHFVKTVHNGIEYAQMQILAEAYLMLSGPAGRTHGQISSLFSCWSRGPAASYLLEISADITATVDPDSDRPILEIIKDAAGHKGTGRWTSEAGLEYGVAIPTIAAAFLARALSGRERLALEKRLSPTKAIKGEAMAEQIGAALPAAMLACYIQGLELIAAASRVNGWQTDLAAVARGWRAGCIIRSVMLDPIASMPPEADMLASAYAKGLLDGSETAMRAVAAMAAASGTPVPCFYSALSWLDGRRSACVGANLIQGQRDYFGAHTFERVDRAGHFHFDWTASTE